MHARRTTFLLLIALLTTGCVAVPHAPAPAPPPRPGELVPAADRPPAPLPTPPSPSHPTWLVPTEPAPREALGATDPRPASRPTEASDRKAAEGTAGVTEAHTARRPPAHRASPNRPHTTPYKPHKPNKPRKPANGKSEHRKPTTRTVPHSPQNHRPTPARPQRQTDARPPEMRRLCRQAESVQAPMGAADLCRNLYGR
ncbi:hypothetical protein ACH4A8_07275 [Streptomyces vietnamensis]|uniref:hypothetical protein n=1 Tax=Streptomyces vietnamensis TaxID=362257 RepID=UPI0037BBC552